MSNHPLFPKFSVGDLTSEEGAVDFLKLNPTTTLSLYEIQATAAACELGLPMEVIDYGMECDEDFYYD